MSAPNHRSALFLLAAVLCSTSLHAAPATGGAGVIDLRKHDLSVTLAALDGLWLFRWRWFGHPVRPIPTAAGGIQTMRVPAEWNRTLRQRGQGSPLGFATYRARVLLPAGVQARDLSLMYRVALTAHRLWVNGRMVRAAGKPGRTADETVPDFGISVVRLRGPERHLDLVFHVANFDHRAGGISDRVYLGTHEAVDRRQFRDIVPGVIVSGALLMMGLYHLGLFLARRRDRAALFFGLFCLVCSTRVFVTGQMWFAHEAIRETLGVSFAWFRRLDYLTVYLASMLFVCFVGQLFLNRFRRHVLLFAAVCVLPFVVGVLVSRPLEFSYHLPFFQIVMCVLALGVLGILVRAAVRRRVGGLSSLLGYVILLVATINDTLYARNVLLTGQVLHYGVVGFVFFQGFTLSQSFAAAQRSVENLSQALENRNVELDLKNNELVRLNRLKDDFLTGIGRSTELKARAANAASRERKRIFSDLHDHLGARLTDLTLLAQRLMNELPDRPIVSEMASLVDDTTDRLRQRLHGIDDLALMAEDFPLGLHTFLLRRYERAGRTLAFASTGESSLLRGLDMDDACSALFLIAQEVCTNDIRYGAGRAQWQLDISDREVVLRQESPTSPGGRSAEQGHGSEIIRSRAAAIGGTIHMQVHEGRHEMRLTIPRR